jgi:alpha-tubulin suppressor-like RCC1 family protein
LTNWLKVSAGFSSSASIKTDGTLWAWGNSGEGQLGLGNRTSYSSPKQVGSLTNWSKVVQGGNSFTAAIKTDGTLWFWGNNSHGQLGTGNLTYYSSPKQVGSLTNWSEISGGYQFSIGITLS